MRNFAKNMVTKIKKEHLKPKPKIFYVIKDVLTISMFILSILFGGLMLSVAVHWMNNVEVIRLGKLPYIWLVFFILFVVFSYFDFRYTKKGYKFGFIKLIGAQVVSTIVFAVLLLLIGVPEEFENFFARNIPFYKGIEDTTREAWDDQKEGFLIGRVMYISPDEHNLKVVDFNRKNWDVDVTNAIIRGQRARMLHAYFKFIGEVEGPNLFEAFEMRRWEKKNLRMQIGIPKDFPFPPPPMPMPLLLP